MNSIPNGRVYEELRFAKVYNLHPNIYSIYIPCTHNMGDNWVHLVVGEEKNLLVDTGYGVGDLRSLVGKITGDDTNPQKQLFSCTLKRQEKKVSQHPKSAKNPCKIKKNGRK